MIEHNCINLGTVEGDEMSQGLISSGFYQEQMLIQEETIILRDVLCFLEGWISEHEPLVSSNAQGNVYQSKLAEITRN